MSRKDRPTNPDQQTLLWSLQSPLNPEKESPSFADTPTMADVTTSVRRDISEVPTLVASEEASTIISTIEHAEVLADRYRVLGILGKGGMGEVLRVFDQKFERTLAMKVIHSTLIQSPLIQQLFIKEAKSTGLLQHPGTVPVHDFGTLSDGRLYFTMQEIQGITLKEAIQAVHRNGPPLDWVTIQNDWSIQRLLDAFERICETMAYAHKLGIMHRDIKPANFMLGTYGEVLVMDWGIAKILPHGEALFPDANTIRPNIGSVVGTPDYIAPEQARGESEEVSARSDVFSLGVVLFEIITGKSIRPSDTDTFMDFIHEKPPNLPVSDAILQSIYQRCITLDPVDRFADADALHTELSKWLDGESKRQNALLLVQKSKEHHRSVLQSHRTIKQLNHKIEQCKKEIQKWSPIEDKQRLWRLEDERDSIQREADYSEINSIEWLHSALNYAPNLSVAHRTLTRIYHAQRQRALLSMDHRQADLMLELMRYHDRGEFATYLSGLGSMTFDTFILSDWILLRFEELQRRLQTIELGELSERTTPLEIGSYLIRSIHNPKHQIPFSITRDQPHIQIDHIDVPVLTDEECWVPGGVSVIGSPTEPSNPRRSIHVKCFIMQKHPVTNRQYLEFLHDLVSTKGIEVALQHVPRTNALSESEAVRLYTWHEDTERFTIEPDPQGDCWDLDWPVIMITGQDAMAYAKWYGAKSDKEWRLPTPEEWEKAARGVDERTLPWGNYFEPTWASVRGHREGRVLPSTIYAHPLDCSVYGVLGLAGNVSDFCVDVSNPEQIYTKGGAWSHHPEFIHLAIVRQFKMDYKLEVCGFRLVRTDLEM